MPEAVVRAQPRAVAVGVEGQPVQFVACQRAVTCDAASMTVASLARHRLAQGDVVMPQVARRELRRLVVDGMGLETLHDRSSLLCPDSGPIGDPASSCTVLARGRLQ